MKKAYIWIICMLLIVFLASCEQIVFNPQKPGTSDTWPDEPADGAFPPQQASLENTSAPQENVIPSGPAEPVDEAPSEAGLDDNAGDNDIVFSDLANMVFWFGSGVGGWHTEATIQPDGTFQGYHQDSDMGDIGPDYPNGTCYICYFSGQFSPLVKINDFEYSMRCLSLTQEGKQGDEEIMEDGIRYIVSTPYGFDDADEFILYLPGRAAAGLPEEFLQWVCAPRGINYETIEILNFWGLYNVSGEEGFSSDGRQYNAFNSVNDWPDFLPDDVPVYYDGAVGNVYADMNGILYIDILNTSREAYEEYVEAVVEAGWEAGWETDGEAGEEIYPSSCSFVKEDQGSYRSMGVVLDIEETTVTIAIAP